MPSAPPSAFSAIMAAAVDMGHPFPAGVPVDMPGEEVEEEDDDNEEEEDVEDEVGDVMFFKKQLRSTLT